MRESVSKKKIDELLSRRVVSVMVKADLRKRLMSGKQLRVKLGFDPTAPDIHLGHTLTLRKLKEFQDLGHQIVFIVGDYTTRVGDPTGKSKTRPMLAEKEIEKNAETYLAQIGKILDIDKVEVRRNSEWFGEMSFADIISLTSKFTAAGMTGREDFKKRMKRGIDVHMHELLYPMMQAYDSVMINADVEIGSTDQLFNMLAGRELQKKMGMKPQVVMTVGPILVGTDGTRKMSKSLNNYIGIDEAPEEMFGKVMSIPDSAMWDYFSLVTDLPAKEIGGMEKNCKQNKMNPRDAKVILAKKIIEMYHSSKVADEAEVRFFKIFAKKQIPDDVPIYSVSIGEHNLVDILVDAQLVKSKSEARRLIEQGGIKVDGHPISDFDLKLAIDYRNIEAHPGKKEVSTKRKPSKRKPAKKRAEGKQISLSKSGTSAYSTKSAIYHRSARDVSTKREGQCVYSIKSSKSHHDSKMVKHSKDTGFLVQRGKRQFVEVSCKKKK